MPFRKKKGEVDAVLDSTGLKVHGEGGWKMRTHGKSKRRTWRKLHLMIDPESREIIADEPAANGVHDAKPVSAMLDKARNPVEKFYGDGIFDARDTCDELSKRNIDPIIPQKKCGAGTTRQLQGTGTSARRSDSRHPQTRTAGLEKADRLSSSVFG